MEFRLKTYQQQITITLKFIRNFLNTLYEDFSIYFYKTVKLTEEDHTLFYTLQQQQYPIKYFYLITKKTKVNI